MNELELLLQATAAEIEWPPAPDLVAAVAGRIHSSDRVAAPARRSSWARSRRHRVRRPLAIALAALLLAAGGAAAIPSVRDPILDFLGVRSVKVERVPRVPLPPAAGAKLELGRHTTLAAAQRHLGFAALLPTGLGRPVVWLDRSLPGGQLGLVYRRGTVFVTELQGRIRREFARKFVIPGTTLEAVRINGERGLWFRGVHEFVYEDARGQLRPDTARLARNTLLWLHGDVLLRLEGVRGKRRAIRIARSVRAAP